MATSGENPLGVLGVSLRHAEVRDALVPRGFEYAGACVMPMRPASHVSGAETIPLPARRARRAGRSVRCSKPSPRRRHARIVVDRHRGSYLPDPADLARPEAPRSTLGFIVHGRRCGARGLAPVTLLSCDNLVSNGRIAAWPGAGLRAAGRCDAGRVDRARVHVPELRWSIASCRRTTISPWSPPRPFFDWAVEDRFAAGRPTGAPYGARFVAHAEPYELLKLRMVNGSHRRPSPTWA